MPEGITWKRLFNDPDEMKYERLVELVLHSGIFNRDTTTPVGEKSDGATGARDLGVIEPGWRGWWARFVQFVLKSYGMIETEAWWGHDRLCKKGCFDDGEPISNFMCSTALSCWLYNDGYKKEAIYWWFATFFFGGGQARKNGMLWVRP